MLSKQHCWEDKLKTCLNRFFNGIVSKSLISYLFGNFAQKTTQKCLSPLRTVSNFKRRRNALNNKIVPISSCPVFETSSSYGIGNLKSHQAVSCNSGPCMQALEHRETMSRQREKPYFFEVLVCH